MWEQERCLQTSLSAVSSSRDPFFCCCYFFLSCHRWIFHRWQNKSAIHLDFVQGRRWGGSHPRHWHLQTWMYKSCVCRINWTLKCQDAKFPRSLFSGVTGLNRLSCRQKIRTPRDSVPGVHGNKQSYYWLLKKKKNRVIYRANGWKLIAKIIVLECCCVFVFPYQTNLSNQKKNGRKLFWWFIIIIFFREAQCELKNDDHYHYHPLLSACVCSARGQAGSLGFRACGNRPGAPQGRGLGTWKLFTFSL